MPSIAGNTKRAPAAISLALSISASHGLLALSPVPIAAMAILGADWHRVLLFGVPTAILLIALNTALIRWLPMAEPASAPEIGAPPLDGKDERCAALQPIPRALCRAAVDLEEATRRNDVAAAYCVRDKIAEMRRLGVTPHISQNTKGRRSAIDGRTTRHAGHAISVRIRKRIEEVFGWVKTVGGLRKTRHRGTARVGWMFTFVAAAYNVVRIPKLLAGAA